MPRGRCFAGLVLEAEPLAGQAHLCLLEPEDWSVLPGDNLACNPAALRATLEERFRSRTRGEWDGPLGGTDACFGPVVSMAEAPRHPHNIGRGTLVQVDGVM